MSDYIPEDIQLMILKHLPVDTLLRFRCVCKRWKQVIDSESFILDHLSIQKPCLFFEYEASEFLVVDPCELPSYSVHPSAIPKQLRVIGTLHGIICLYNSNVFQIVLCNPWTQNMMRVGPKSPYYNWYAYNDDGFSLGPSCGFWIDPFTKEFKVIMFPLCDDEEPDEDCGLYSSTRGNWKKIPHEDKLEYCYTCELAPALVVNNVGHWTVYYDYTDDKGQDMVGILVLLFDFKQEIFLESIRALSIKKGWNRPVLCNRDGALSLVYMDPETSFDVFSRKEGKWVNVHSFFVFSEIEKFIWREEQVDDKERKTRIVAAVTGGLVPFDTPDMILCISLMIKIKEAKDVVIANGFVESLLSPVTEC